MISNFSKRGRILNIDLCYTSLLVLRISAHQHSSSGIQLSDRIRPVLANLWPNFRFFRLGGLSAFSFSL